MQIFLRSFVLSLSIFLLTACGFHLRGDVQLAPSLHRLYVKTNDPYGQLAKNLKEYLRMSKVELTTEQSDATSVLEIISEQQYDQLLSTGGTQQTRQYNLILTVKYQITNAAGKIILPLQAASETRSITIQASQILAGSNESVAMYQQMKRAIIFDIINRLSSKEVTALLQGNQ